MTVNTTEGAAYGTALLAGVGAGIWPNVEAAADAVIKVTGSTTPDDETREAYDAHYRLYRGLYPALKPANDALAGL